ncbi:MAG TPA: winged helix-turn-helix domain-containing protein [Enhygromyxa sp.]|nr:winged helix-turn-helix domain-containing protein [Enhygromyxa sp.]
MTFLEAAIEVLRSSEEPLHYMEIARLAVERKLLSHVGRDPEAAMQSCLNSAVRSKVHDGLVMRSKPGHYCLKEGAEIPELPPTPSEREREPLRDVEDEDFGDRKKPKDIKPKAAVVSTPPQPKPAPKRELPPPAVEAEDENDAGDEDAGQDDEASEDDEDQDDELTPATVLARAPVQTSLPMPVLDPSKVRFRGPEGSGLEGETDVALVMANAMSRLVDERPELREELEAMQKGQAPVPEVIEVGRKKRLDDDRLRERDRERDRDRDRDRDDDRGGRRRRRRRRRGRRVEWSEGGGARSASTRGIELLDKVATVLAEAGTRSLHVRQIAEHLAAQNVLGGEISEIERAVTAAILLDVHRRGDASRFAVRGDARYQLRGSRLPEKAALAERAARAALLALETETEAQLLLWLQSLGARSLEALVRIWLEREDYGLVATLPPSRGLGKLVADEPELEDEDGRTLVLIVPRKTAIEPKLWEGEAERNGCSGTLVFSMADASGDPAALGDARVIFAKDFARWLLRHGIGVQTLEIKVPVLDANLIESIAGLDT